MQVITIIQARMSSTRLPGKCLLPIGGIPMLEHVLNAAPHPRCIALPNEPASVSIVKAFAEKDVDMFIPGVDVGTDDVLGRFAACVQEYYPFGLNDFVLRLTGDCPRLRISLVEYFLHLCIPYDVDTIYTNRPLDMDGYDMELFSVAALLNAHRRATSAEDREHVTPYMYRTMHVRRHSVWDNAVGTEEPGKMSVDTKEDLNRVVLLMEEAAQHE